MDVSHPTEYQLDVVNIYPIQSRVATDESLVLNVSESIRRPTYQTSCAQQLDKLSLESALPVEIMFDIFTLATNFHHFDPPPLDGSTTCDLIAEWKESLRCRKALLLVCQTWRSAGLPFIFEHIVITEIPQLAKIVQLVENSSEPGRWTKTIFIRSVVMSHWHDLYESHIARLISACPNVTRLIDHVVDGALNDHVFRHMPMRIHDGLRGPHSAPLQVLDLVGDDATDLHILFHVAPTLRSLAIRGI